MYNRLLELYQLDGSSESIDTFKNKILIELDGSDPFHDIFKQFLVICHNDFESVSELNTLISKVSSNLYEYNETLRFDDPIRNHIPVMLSLIKSIVCSEIGKIATDVQDNHEAATQLYGLALDHLLQGETILSALEIRSQMFENFKIKYLTNFMDSYAEFAGLENMHSSITLKHHLLGTIESDSYTNEVYSSMGHGFYNIYSKLSDISPKGDWMPFTSEYLADKCVQAHKKAYEIGLLDESTPQLPLTKYYIQSMMIYLESLIVSAEKSFKIFFDYGLYDLANKTASKLTVQCENYKEEVIQFKEYKVLEEHIEKFLSNYEILSEMNSNHKNTSISYFELLKNASNNNFSVTVSDNTHHNLPVVFSKSLETISDTFLEEERNILLKIIIQNSSDIYSMDHERLFHHTTNGLKYRQNAAKSKEFYEQLLENTEKLEQFGITVLNVEDENKPKIDNYDSIANSHLTLLKETLNDKVKHFQFLLELSKVVGFNYNRRDLITFRAIRSLISIGRKTQYMDTFFDDVKDDMPVALTLRLKSTETISKALYQLSKHKNENNTIDALIFEFNSLMNSTILFSTRDEAKIYEYSDNVRIFNALIKEVLGDAANQKSRVVSEYAGYIAFDRKIGWTNLLDKASSLKKASIIHKHAFEFLMEHENATVAKQALEESKRCEAEYNFLCALYYESQKGSSLKADELFSKSIEAYAEAGIEVAVEAATARKFWLREQNKSYRDV